MSSKAQKRCAIRLKQVIVVTLTNLNGSEASVGQMEASISSTFNTDLYCFMFLFLHTGNLRL